MSEWEIIDNPQLPPIRIRQKKSRAELKSDGKAQSILGLKSILLTQEFEQFITKLYGLNAALNPLILQNCISSHKNPEDFYLRFARIYNSFFTGLYSTEDLDFDKNRAKILGSVDCNINPEIEKLVFSHLNSAKTNYNDLNSMLKRIINTSDKAKGIFEKYSKETNEKSIKKVRTASDSLEQTVIDFEKKHQIEILILANITMYICPNCKKILATGKFNDCKCICGIQVEKTSDAEKIPVSRLPKSIVDIFANSIWFEEGLAYIFKRENFKVHVGYQVLGNSGNDHEIDIIAEKNHTRLAVECKTGQFGINDIFVFSGKLHDIGVSTGLLCIKGNESDSKLRQIGKANGITLIYDVLDKQQQFWKDILVRVM